jgi:hypothetical protein
VEEGDAFLPESEAHHFQMHQMGAAFYLDIALHSRLGECVEQPIGVIIRDQSVPLSADDRNWRPDQRRVAGKVAVPSSDDLAEGAKRRLDARGIARSALRIAVQILLDPLVEMNSRKNRRLMGGNIFDKPIPLIFRCYDPPCRV